MKKKALTRRFLTRNGPVDDAFRKLSAAQKRVAVVTDALRWLKAKVVTAQAGTYVAPSRTLYGDIEASAVSLEGVHLLSQAHCQVCAKGALFLATVMRTNAMRVNATLFAGSDCRVSDKVCSVERIFCQRMFNDIEEVFEDRLVYSPRIEIAWSRYPKEVARRRRNGAIMRTENGLKVFDALGSEASQDMRLKAILVNIIIHKGTFKRSYVPTCAEIKKWLAKV